MTDEAVDINLSKGYRVHPVTTADKRAELDGARLVAVVGVKQVRPQELLSSMCPMVCSKFLGGQFRFVKVKTS